MKKKEEEKGSEVIRISPLLQYMFKPVLIVYQYSEGSLARDDYIAPLLLI